MTLAYIFNINQNIFKVYNSKNIKFFYKDLIVIGLKSGSNIK